MIDSNKTCFIFDVDGTLTKPRQKMEQKFEREFFEWVKNKQVFLATGSDYPKTQYQVPLNILRSMKMIFCCMGNETRNSNGLIAEKSKFVIPEELNLDLMKILDNSPYLKKVGNHIEFRTGMINFSIVGRNATMIERDEYNKWDLVNQERSKIVNFINKKYPTLNASVGGSISIDIIEEGKDKGQIIHYLENVGATKVVFVGDRCEPGGNDHGIIRELCKSNLAFEWYNVNGPHETLTLIRTNKVFDGGK